MSKIVIIDDLPQPGDHSAFVDDDKRYSDFTVSFDESNPNFVVTLAPKKGGTERTLTLGTDYTLEISTKTEFERDKDWVGKGEGWIDITSLSNEELRDLLKTARSFRVIIVDPEGFVKKDIKNYLMAQQSQVHISFNAKTVDPDVQPGQVAWNSFGYKYQVPLTFKGTEEASTYIALEAQPLNVGVRYPAAPTLEKTLTTMTQKMEQAVEKVKEPVMVQATDPETGEPLEDEEGNPVMVQKTEPVLDPESGEQMTDPETGEPMTQLVYEEVERPKTTQEERPVLDPDTGEQMTDPETGEPMTQMVEVPVMVPVTQQVIDPETGEPMVDEEGSLVTEPVMEVVSHKASQDLTFGFIVYTGEPISDLDNALNMKVADIVQLLESGNREYLYIPLYIAEGSSSAKVELWKYDYRSHYNAETGQFFYTGPAAEGEEEVAPDWHWENNAQYTVIELPLGDYNYEFRSIKVNNATHTANNVTFSDRISSIITLLATNEWMPEYVDVVGEKVWDDKKNQDGARPEQITVRLLADGEEVDSRTVTAADNWSFSFEHLLKRHETGSAIVYQVTEDAVSDYSTVVEVSPDNPYSFTFTNTHEPGKCSVLVAKAWDDENDKDSLRPKSVVVHLWADGEDTGKSLELSKDNNWQGSFTSLDEYSDGTKIEYSITADEVSGYTTVIDGSAEQGFVVTNIHIPDEDIVIPRHDTPSEPDEPDEPGNPTKPDNPDEPDEPDEPDNPDKVWESKVKKSKTSIPGLGDYVLFAAAGGLFVTAYIALIVVSMRRRKEKQ